MKKVFNLRILGVLTLLSLVSCEKSFEPVAVLEENSLSVSDAKEWFEDASKNARTSDNDLKSQVFWKYALKSKMDREEKRSVVVVPISHGREGKVYGLKQLWIYKNRDGKNTMRVVEFIYDKDVPKKEAEKQSLKNFTGAMLVREWNDDDIGGLRYKGGQLFSALQLAVETVNGKKQKVKTAKNGRIGSEGHDWYSQAFLDWYYGTYDDFTEWRSGVEGCWGNAFDLDGAAPMGEGGGGIGGNDDYWSGGGGGGFPDLDENVGTFVLSSADQYKYPKFTQVVKDLYNFVKNDQKVIASLKQWSGFSENEILDKIRFGNGPTIVIKNLGGDYGAFK